MFVKVSLFWKEGVDAVAGEDADSRVKMRTPRKSCVLNLEYARFRFNMCARAQ